MIKDNDSLDVSENKFDDSCRRFEVPQPLTLFVIWQPKCFLLIQFIGLSKIKVSSMSFRHDITVLDVSCIVLNLISGISLHKISRFPLKISPVNLTKSKVSFETGKLRFLCSKGVFTIVSVKIILLCSYSPNLVLGLATI